MTVPYPARFFIRSRPLRQKELNHRDTNVSSEFRIKAECVITRDKGFVFKRRAIVFIWP